MTGAFEVAQRYAAGQIDRDSMIETLATWEYDPPFQPHNVLDDLGSSGPGTFERTVGRAYDASVISAEDYEAICARRLAFRADA